MPSKRTTRSSKPTEIPVDLTGTSSTPSIQENNTVASEISKSFQKRSTRTSAQTVQSTLPSVVQDSSVQQEDSSELLEKKERLRYLFF